MVFQDLLSLKLNFHLSIVFAIALTPGEQSLANMKCTDFVSGIKVSRINIESQNESVIENKEGIHLIASVTDYELPPHFHKIIRQHKIAKALKEKFGTGSDLTIEMSYYSEQFHKNGILPKHLFISRGEAIQSVFVAKTILSLLPEVKFAERGSVPTTPHSVKIRISDSYENGVGPEDQSLIQMSVAKYANPGVGKLNRTKIRDIMGIPHSTSVISLNLAVGINSNQAVEIFKKLQTRNSDILILSKASTDFNSTFVDEMTTAFPDRKILFLSKIGHNSFERDHKYIILNDTAGKMHAVFAIANIAVMAGAINISEPLLVGTPVIFFDHSTTYMQKYNREAFASIEKVIVQSKGAFPVSSLDQMLKSVDDITLRPHLSDEIIPPYELNWGPWGGSIINDYLRNLYHALLPN